MNHFYSFLLSFKVQYHFFTIISCMLLGSFKVASQSNLESDSDIHIDTTVFKKHTLSPGLVMAGYQGWFNAPKDHTGRQWHHYEKSGEFKPGTCTIDVWPEMKEYKKTYETSFTFKDGSPAKVFSSNDESTVNLHFKWMNDYGIDGVFMQRFVSEIKSKSGLDHFNKVLNSASKSALEFDRTISVMYDLSGMTSDDVDIVISDWKNLLSKHQYHKRDKYTNYLFYKNKPVVSIWGVGFNDNRKYNLDDIEKLIRFFKSDEGGNCSVLLGVPTHWREQGSDCIKDQRFHDIIKMADVVHPWLVGRFNEESYSDFKSIIGKDQQWCNANDLKYMPVVFPGFSWNNMYKEGRSSSTIPRNSGNFFWKQLHGATNEGAQMIYIAMFDEIDEGTAIFKIARKVPVGKSTFIPLDKDISSDYYLWLSGKAGNLLKKKKPFPIARPLKTKNLKNQ